MGGVADGVEQADQNGTKAGQPMTGLMQDGAPPSWAMHSVLGTVQRTLLKLGKLISLPYHQRASLTRTASGGPATRLLLMGRVNCWLTTTQGTRKLPSPLLMPKKLYAKHG